MFLVALLAGKKAGKRSPGKIIRAGFLLLALGLARQAHAAVGRPLEGGDQNGHQVSPRLAIVVGHTETRAIWKLSAGRTNGIKRL